MVMPTPEMQAGLARFEPDADPMIAAELAGEVARLTAGTDGESEIERIYRDNPGPVSRRRALQKLSGKRLAVIISEQRRGAIELTAICQPHRVTLELAWSPNSNWLATAPCAQHEINLPILRAERGPLEQPPNGQPEGTW